MAIDLFGCPAFSNGGLKKLKIATRDTTENPLQFPIDMVLKTGDESTVILSDDEANRTITIGTQQIQYRIVYPVHSVVTEEEINDRQGRYYVQELSFDLPKLNLTTLNQLKQFLFTSVGEFAISQAILFLQDMNDQNWIVGYQQPLVLDSFELTTGTSEGDNRYSLKYSCRSYARIRSYEVV